MWFLVNTSLTNLIKRIYPLKLTCSQSFDALCLISYFCIYKWLKADAGCNLSSWCIKVFIVIVVTQMKK